MVAMFDWTINLGHILTILGFLGVGATGYVGVRSFLAVMSVKLDIFGGRVLNIEVEMREMNKTITTVAVQNERMDGFDRRIVNLEASTEAHRRWVREEVLAPRLHATEPR